MRAGISGRKWVENQVIYRFESAQVATRFLNTLTHWAVADVDARYHEGNFMVKVTYEYASGGFDTTSSELDDLAARHGGYEVS